MIERRRVHTLDMETDTCATTACELILDTLALSSKTAVTLRRMLLGVTYPSASEMRELGRNGGRS